MAKGYCERCNKEKPVSKGGFCPDCLTHTNTYYADQPRSDIIIYGGFKNVTIEPEAFIVTASVEPQKKTGKYSEEKLKTKTRRNNRHPPIPKDDRSRAKKRLENLDSIIDKKLIEEICSRYPNLKFEIEKEEENAVKRKQQKREEYRKHYQKLKEQKTLSKQRKKERQAEILASLEKSNEQSKENQNA
jgi:hypothetical protein